jgi:hypothetical protein
MAKHVPMPRLVPPDNPRRERPAHEVRPSERQVPANRPVCPPVGPQKK